MGILTDGPLSLFARFNKVKGNKEDSQKEGVIESLGELTLEMDDAELLQLKKDWESLYSSSAVKKRIHGDGDQNERYWAGRQFPDTEYEGNKRPLSDNNIFDNFETMVPLASQQPPMPIVMTSNDPAATQVGDKIKMALEYLSQYNTLKTKLKKGVRHWGLRFLGVWQVGYDAKEKEIIVKSLNPKELILDPNGWIEDGRYYGEFLGKRMTDTAANLVIRFPEKEDDIQKACEMKMGSLMSYTQWWTNDYVFYTLKDIVLQKSKNPHWNYDQEATTVDELGQPIQKILPGINHLPNPEMPFVFLTVFDLGDEPADKTSLVSQSLVTQDNINKRLKQIDRNADNINGGVIVSGLVFNKEQAAQVAAARREGRTIVVPTGSISESIQFPQNQNLPSALFDNLNDQRQRLAARFGTLGSTAEGTEQEETVRGKIVAGNNDSSRIGGGVSEYLEIAASRIFNYWVQMMYVYYDAPHLISVIGASNAVQMVSLQNSEMFPAKFVVQVQNGSMIPQDPLSEYNEAMALWEGGALDPLSLFERLKDPNPQERAIKLMTFKVNPMGYMQEFLQMQPPPMPVAPGGQPPPGGGAPPASVQVPPPAPSPIKQQESQIIKSVPIQ